MNIIETKAAHNGGFKNDFFYESLSFLHGYY